MLVDLGNSDALWLFPNRIPHFNYNRPNIDDFLEEDSMETFMEKARIHAKIRKNTLNEPISFYAKRRICKIYEFCKVELALLVLIF
jgi:hypothetical protein